MENKKTYGDEEVEKLRIFLSNPKYHGDMVYAMGYWFAQEDYDDIVKWCKGDLE